ncbi:MAG: prolipoprotein diacylglyceryl transferase [Bryobacteraceae bacterium]|nr:prolipoprotein diacylglyceryl transferase [Bryobacteraceae bacterium]
MLPRLISIGGFSIPTYGVLVALGFLAGLTIATRLARRSGIDGEKATNLGVYSALAGLLGAKLLMFLFDWRYFSANPGDIFSLSTLQAAGVFQGGLLLAIAFAFWYIRRAKLPILSTLDAFAPGITLGHAIGRVGCFAAGCCTGTKCDRPWAVTFTDPNSQVPPGHLGVPLHPAQLYESALLLFLFTALYRAWGRPHQPGTIFALYLILSALIRFGVEFFRHHAQELPFGLPLSLTQWIALAILAGGVGMLLRVRGLVLRAPGV